MKYKLLGKTGVLVSELCFGTMTFGSEADETESTQMFNQCRNAVLIFLIVQITIAKAEQRLFLVN